MASRFSSAGRPSARHLLESVPWTRAPVSDAIVLTGGLAALDCRLDRLIAAGDHVLALLELADVLAVDPAAPPLRPAARPLRRRVGPPPRPAVTGPREKFAGSCHIRGLGGAYPMWNSCGRSVTAAVPVPRAAQRGPAPD